MSPRQLRIDDPDDFEPPRRNNGQRSVGRILLGMAVVAVVSAAVTVLGLKAVPGGIVIGPAEEVARLKARVDDLSVVDDRMANRVGLDEAALLRLEGFAAAVTREKCSQYGREKAQNFGYDCDGLIVKLPGTP